MFHEDKERRIKKLGAFLIYEDRRIAMCYNVLINEITHRFVLVMLLYPHGHIVCQYDRSDPMRYQISIAVGCLRFGSRKWTT
jgi:hypothetical protein